MYLHVSTKYIYLLHRSSRLTTCIYTVSRLRDLVHLARAFRTISLDQQKRVPTSIWEVAMVELAPINSNIVHGPFGNDKKSWRECFTMGKL